MKLPSSLADWIKQGDQQRQKRRKPVPGLAEHIALFSGRKAKKDASCAILASFATRIYALSIPKTRERL